VGIVEEDIAKVRSATDFVQLAGEHVALRKVGRRWNGLCPFHPEKSPSFSLNAEEGLYYCFGCGAKGDVISFVRDLEHLSFVESVEKLAARSGIALRYDDAAVDRDHQRRIRLQETLELAVEWYHQRLMSSRDASGARAYLRSRGYDGEVVRQYRLGWAPDGFDNIVKALGDKLGQSRDALLGETGLAFRNKADRLQDSFRARVLFPIFDPSGRPIGFGGRVLVGGSGPKYKNTAETALYAKSRTLYGLNWAKEAVVRLGRVVVCEGYTDVIGLHRAGVGEAVATCGTALAEGHVRVLANFARRIILAYDADGAGQAAAERFYAWEKQFDADIAVAALPAGSDPADLAASDPSALEKAIAEARPYLDFRLERLFGRSDLSGHEGRARAASAAMELLSEHPNELVKDQYLMQVADRCSIEPALLRSGAWREARPAPGGAPGRTGGSARPTDRRAGPERGPRPPVDDRDPDEGSSSPVRIRGAGLRGPEIEALRLAVHRREEMLGRLDEFLFADQVNRTIYRRLVGAVSLHQAIEDADGEVVDRLQRLAVEEATEQPDDVMVRLIERTGARALAKLQREARAAEDPAGYAPAVGWLKLELERLREPETTRDAESRLVPWLMAHGQGD